MKRYAVQVVCKGELIGKECIRNFLKLNTFLTEGHHMVKASSSQSSLAIKSLSSQVKMASSHSSAILHFLKSNTFWTGNFAEGHQYQHMNLPHAKYLHFLLDRDACSEEEHLVYT